MRIDTFVLYAEDGWWQQALAYALYMPLVVFIGVSFVHLFVWDVVSVLLYWIDFFIAWIPLAIVARAAEQRRPYLNNNSGAPPTYLGRYAMPDPWQTTFILYMLTWSALAYIYKRKVLRTPLIGMWIATLLFEVAILANNYASAVQTVVSAAIAVALAPPIVLLIDRCFGKDSRRLASSALAKRFGIVSIVYRDIRDEP